MTETRKIRVRFKKTSPEVRADAEHWITLHPNGKDATGTPALINGAGQIIGGAGGKLTGKVVSPTSKSAPKPGTEEQHAPAIWLGPANPEDKPQEKKPEATQEPKPAEAANPADDENSVKLKKMEQGLESAKEVLEKAQGYPDFMRKEMQADIDRREAEIADFKKQGDERPEQKPVEAKKPASEVRQPEMPTPEPEPEVKAETNTERIEREADKMAENVKTFETAEAVYKKYQEALSHASGENLVASGKAQEIQDKLMAARRRMSEIAFETSDRAKTKEEHENGVKMHRKLYDLTRYTSMGSAHARAHNDHLKAIKKMDADKRKAEKRQQKAEEKKSGIKSKDTEAAERYAKATPSEIDSKFREKYGAGFISKPDVSSLEARRISLMHEMQAPGITLEEKREKYMQAEQLREQIYSAEKYQNVRHFRAVDINAKTPTARNARKVIAHIEDTLDSLTSRGYDIKAVMAASGVEFASGSTGKYGGLAWGSPSGEGVRRVCIDANKYFNTARQAEMEGAEDRRVSSGQPRWNAGSGIGDTIVHEIAHAVGMNKSRESPKRLGELLKAMEPDHVKRNKWIRDNISEYGSSNIKETDAELAAKVLSPNYKRGTLPKSLEDHVDWLFMKKGA